MFMKVDAHSHTLEDRKQTMYCICDQWPFILLLQNIINLVDAKFVYGLPGTLLSWAVIIYDLYISKGV